MSWDDVGHTEHKDQGGGERKLFLPLKEGENLVRIVEGPEVFKTHWVQTAHYPKGIGLKCPGSQICPLCQMGEGTQERAMFTVIDRSAKGKVEVKLLDAPKTVAIGLKSLALNPNWGDPSRYDVTITKDSTGNFTRYTSVPNPIVELTPDERNAVAEFQQNISIKEVASPDSPEQIKTVLEGKEITRGKPKQGAPQAQQPAPQHFVTGMTVQPPPPAQPQYAPPTPQYQQPAQPQYPQYQQPVQPQYPQQQIGRAHV